MKHSARILSILLAIVMVAALVCVFTLGSSAATADDYKKVTGEITEGDYIIASSCDSGTFAMTSTIVSKRLSYTSVTVNGDTITTNNSSIVWHIAKSGNAYTIYNESATAYAAGTGVKNNMGTSTDASADASKWTVTEDGGVYTFTNVGNKAAGVNATLKFNFDKVSTGETAYVATYSDTYAGGLVTLYKASSSQGTTCEHAYGEGVETTPATCTTAGVKTFTCGKCGDTKTEPISAKGHTIENGACETCGAVVFTKVTPEELTDGTQIVLVVSKSAMTTEKGSKGYKGVAVRAGETIVVDPTYMVFTYTEAEAGYFYLVSAEGLYLTSGATGMSVTLEETPTEYSTWEFVTVDGTQMISSENASYTDKNGNFKNQALECYNGEIYTYSYTQDYTSMGAYEVEIFAGEEGAEPHTHTWDDGVETTPATCTKDGVMTYTCSCGATKIDKIFAKGHKFVNGICEYCREKEQKETYAIQISPDKVKNGSKLILSIGGNVMTSAMGTKGFNGVAGEVTNAGLAVKEEYIAFVLEGEISGQFYLKADGKYLTSAETGSAVSLESEKTDLALWEIVTVDGTQMISSVNALYTGSNGVSKRQALEYYNGQIYTYGYTETYTGMSAYEAVFYTVESGNTTPGTGDASVYFVIAAIVALCGMAVVVKKVHA